MLRSKSVQPLYGRPAHVKVENPGDKTKAKTRQIKLRNSSSFTSSLGSKRELRLRVDENAILKPAPAKHDTRLDMWILG
jgi:hypothetical protein